MGLRALHFVQLATHGRMRSQPQLAALSFFNVPSHLSINVDDVRQAQPSSSYPTSPARTWQNQAPDSPAAASDMGRGSSGLVARTDSDSRLSDHVTSGKTPQARLSRMGSRHREVDSGPDSLVSTPTSASLSTTKAVAMAVTIAEYRALVQARKAEEGPSSPSSPHHLLRRSATATAGLARIPPKVAVDPSGLEPVRIDEHEGADSQPSSSFASGPLSPSRHLGPP